ncbi:MAG: hypothetical protein HFJ54_09165 [Clostridia bacterium]|nr:hypothetical protein [Clostridia bacterium]
MKTKENGITLIALIVTIVLLVVLTAVVIKGITGEEGIIEVSTTATEDYNILQYKEQIEALRESIILKAEVTGERITLEKLAKEMAKEATWIKSAIANVSESANDINDDIIITTTDGYIFQVYYSENYGQRFIEYLGREDGNLVPKVTVSKVNNKINVQASEDISGINKIEVIYKGSIVKTENSTSLDYEAPNTGWYVIRVTSNAGKLRYAWIRVSSTMIAPKIEIVNPEVKPTSGWYKENVTVRISAGSDKTSKIYYTIANWKEDPSLEITEAEKINGIIAKDVELKLQGMNTIYAYAVDEGSGESEIVSLNVLIDSEAPILKDINMTGIKGENGWYRGAVGIELKNARDNASGVKGYYYYKLTEEEIENNFIPSLDQMKGDENGNPLNVKETSLSMPNDGIQTVIIRLEDNAGNVSEPITITAKVDNTPPIISFVEVKEENIAGDGFIISAQASDQPLDNPLSEVTYFYYVQEVGTIGRSFIRSTKESRCMVEGLKPETEYIVYVEVKDEAGNTAKAEDGAGIKVTTGEEGTQINPGGNGRWWRPVEIKVDKVSH